MLSSTAAPLGERSRAGAPRPGRDLSQALALSLAARPARPAAAGLPGLRAPARRQVRDDGDALHLQMGDRRARGGHRRAGRRPRPPAGSWLWRAPILLTVLYGVARIAMALLTQVRDGLFAKVAMHAVRQLALQDLRAHAPPVAALPSRAQDRRADPRARARPQRHRGAVAPLGADAHPDDRRVRARARHPRLRVRLALLRRRARDGGASISPIPTRRPSGGSRSASG